MTVSLHQQHINSGSVTPRKQLVTVT